MKIVRIFLVASLVLLGCGSDDENTADNAATEGGSAATAGSAGASGEPTAGSDANEPDANANANDECGTVHEVTSTDDTQDIDVYMDFSPEDITIAAGDCVNFVMSRTHNAVEVSQETYETRGSGPLTGGFEVGFGETQQIKFDTPGVHYYVCQPHVGMDMVGTITVQ